jgi:hypothetical protein
LLPKFQLKRRKLNGAGEVPLVLRGSYASALFFVQSGIGFIRRRFGIGTLGFAQCSFAGLCAMQFSRLSFAFSLRLEHEFGSISSVILA